MSAGFKVSAAGGSGAMDIEISHESRKQMNKTASHMNINEVASKYYAVHKISTMSEQPLKLHDEKSQISVVRKSYR